MKLPALDQNRQVDGTTINLSRFIKGVKQKLGRIVLSGVIAGIVSYPVVSFIPEKYTSTATVLIKAQADNISPFPAIEGYDSTRSGYSETLYSLMQSRIVLERAIQDMQLDKNKEFARVYGLRHKLKNEQNVPYDERVLDILSKNLSVDGVRTTNLATISYESVSPELSAEIANGVAQAFINYSVEQKRLKAERVRLLDYQKLMQVQQSIIEQKAEIDRFLKEEKLLTFRGIDGFETEQLSITTSKLAEATQRRIAAESLYKEINSPAVHSLDGVISLPSISSHAQIQDLRIALIQAKRQLYDLKKSYGPKHEKVLVAAAQVKAVQDQTQQVLDELKTGIEQKYHAAMEDEKQYQSQLVEQKKNYQALAEKRSIYNSKQIELNKTEEIYKTLFQRTQELSLSSVDEDTVLYDPAVPALVPSKPHKKLLLIMIVLLAQIVSFIYVIIRLAQDKSINTMDDLKRLMSAIPLGKVGLFTGGSRLGDVLMLATEDAAKVDVIHGIRSNIILERHSFQVFAITSIVPGEGCSLLASLLANSFCYDQKTLLIDANFSDSEGLSSTFSSQNPAGVIELLSGAASFESAKVRLSSNLDFLPRGVVGTVSSQLLFSSEKVGLLVDELRCQYARIIIDVAAVNQSMDIQLVTRFIDGVIVVIKAGNTSVDSVNDGISKIINTKDIEIRTVLNFVNQDD